MAFSTRMLTTTGWQMLARCSETCTLWRWAIDLSEPHHGDVNFLPVMQRVISPLISARSWLWIVWSLRSLHLHDTNFQLRIANFELRSHLHDTQHVSAREVQRNSCPLLLRSATRISPSLAGGEVAAEFSRSRQESVTFCDYITSFFTYCAALARELRCGFPDALGSTRAQALPLLQARAHARLQRSAQQDCWGKFSCTSVVHTRCCMTCPTNDT